MSEASKAHIKWKRRVAKRLPALAMRVFALRGTGYSGCGFHYSMERSLGNVLALTNNFDYRFDAANAVIDEVLVESLYRDVAAAEASAFSVNDRGA